MPRLDSNDERKEEFGAHSGFSNIKGKDESAQTGF